MEREDMGPEPELNPHQRRAAKEGGDGELVFGYCPTCRHSSWMEFRNKHWVCRACGCPIEGEVKMKRGG